MTETKTHFTTQGLVIKEMNIGENDRLVTLLTKDFGILKAYVPGAKSIKSKRSAASSLLTYSHFSLTRRGDFYRITEASVITSFFSLGTGVEILALAQYFCELAGAFAEWMTPNEEILRLILNSLNFIIKEGKYPPFIKSITEFRIAVISGYMPDLLACGNCGKFEDAVMFFNIQDGSLICTECAESYDGLIPLDRTMLTALRHIAFSKFGKLYSFSIPDNTADKLSKITEKYLTFQTDYRFAALDFYNSLTQSNIKPASD